MHSTDHIAAAQERGHLLQQLGAGVQGAHAHGGVQLVSGAGCEIHVQLLHVYGGVGCALGAVQHHHSAHGVGALDDLLHGGAQAQHIGDHCNADQLGLGGNFLIQFVQRQAAVLTGVHIHQLCAGGFGHALPGHQVGVMLSHRDDDFIALMQKVHAVAVGHQIQRLGGVLGKDDLVILGVKELGYGVASTLVGIGGTHGQLVHAAMGVGVILIIVVHHGVQHLLGVLGGGGTVQINQAVAVLIGRQDREISRPVVHHQASVQQFRAPRCAALPAGSSQ